MVIAPTDKNWGNMGFPMSLGIPPAATSGGAVTTEQGFSFVTASSPDFTGSTTTDQSTSLDWFIIFRTVNISLPGFHPSIIHLLNLYLAHQRNYLFYKVVGIIYL